MLPLKVVDGLNGAVVASLRNETDLENAFNTINNQGLLKLLRTITGAFVAVERRQDFRRQALEQPTFHQCFQTGRMGKKGESTLCETSSTRFIEDT